MREVVDFVGAPKDAGKKRLKVEAAGGGPRVAPSFDDLHRFMLPHCSQGFESILEVEYDSFVSEDREKAKDVLGDVGLEIIRKSRFEDMFVGDGLYLQFVWLYLKFAICSMELISSIKRSTPESRFLREALPSTVKVHGNGRRIPELR